MRFELETPTRAYISDNPNTEELEKLVKELTYTNTAAAHDVKRHYNNMWLRRKDGDVWQKKLDYLKSLVKNTLIFTADDNRQYIRPGSIPHLETTFSLSEPKYKFPGPKKVAWAHTLPFTLHPYQEESVTKLLAIRHGNVQLCTGAGKSAIILKLCRETGFKTAIVAPSKSIFLELVEAFEHYLGKGSVGTFGDGKKKIGKRFTICIGDSLANVKPGTEEWEFFSKLDMLIVDESHTWGAETLETICHGILADVPYRFFMSGTQTRGDGTEKLLQSIIGETVHTLTTAEAVAGGYICPHNFCIVRMESSNPNYNSREPLEEKRIHFLNNRNIAAFIAKLCNASGRQCLVLVEELPQIVMLSKLLTVPFAIAHSEKGKERLQKLGLEKVNPKESVDKFNKGEVQVLMGTSCISTGTNIYPMRHTFNWVGGASEIKTKQGPIGRSVRLGRQNPYAVKCAKKEIVTIWDFDIHDIESMDRHLDARIISYQESGSEIKRIDLNAQKTQTGGIR
jgi:superfamily II DNA or RNA helicase